MLKQYLLSQSGKSICVIIHTDTQTALNTFLRAKTYPVLAWHRKLRQELNLATEQSQRARGDPVEVLGRRSHDSPSHLKEYEGVSPNSGLSPTVGQHLMDRKVSSSHIFSEVVLGRRAGLGVWSWGFLFGGLEENLLSASVCGVVNSCLCAKCETDGLGSSWTAAPSTPTPKIGFLMESLTDPLL